MRVTVRLHADSDTRVKPINERNKQYHSKEEENIMRHVLYTLVGLMCLVGLISASPVAADDWRKHGSPTDKEILKIVKENTKTLNDNTDLLTVVSG